MLILFGGVSEGKEEDATDKIKLPEGRQQQYITSGNARLVVEPSSDGRCGIALYSCNKDKIDRKFAQPYPLEIQIVESSDVNYWLKRAYSRITASDCEGRGESVAPGGAV